MSTQKPDAAALERFRETLLQVAERLEDIRQQIENVVDDAQELVGRAETCIAVMAAGAPELPTWWEKHCGGADADLEDLLDGDILVGGQVDLDDLTTLATHLRTLSEFGDDEGEGDEDEPRGEA